eukprot:UN27692
MNLISCKVKSPNKNTKLLFCKLKKLKNHEIKCSSLTKLKKKMNLFFLKLKSSEKFQLKNIYCGC